MMERQLPGITLAIKMRGASLISYIKSPALLRSWEDRIEDLIIYYIKLSLLYMYLQDGTDDQPSQPAAAAKGEGEEPKPKPRSGTVDLELDTSLQVEISDALSEQDKVKFTVHTKVLISETPEIGLIIGVFFSSRR